MAKTVITITKKIELERGMIFRSDDNIYVLTLANEDGGFILTNLNTGRRYSDISSLDDIAEQIEKNEMDFLGYGSEFKLVKKERR